jgi:hypothetical protein
MSTRTLATLSLLLCLGITTGCAAQETERTSPTPSQEPAATQPAPAPVEIATGTVVETMDAAGYTYVRLDLGDKEIWAAGKQFEVKVGDRVSVPLEMPMTDFHSQTLDRDFPLIYFASVIFHGEKPAAAAAAAHGAGTQPVADVDSSKIEPVAGGMTVAQVWAARSELAGKPVTVRGKVVKFNAGILGRNWIHIQDGSGSAAQADHDLTITTAGTTKVGEVISVTGTLVVDQDFGAGYTYALLIEDATLSSE